MVEKFIKLKENEILITPADKEASNIDVYYKGSKILCTGVILIIKDGEIYGKR
jgi:hypothetical protein